MESVKKNFIYNVLYQILVLLIPLITVPYVSRTLGVDGVGVYSYTYSIVYYFVLASMLGINNYGSRTIAKYRENKKELSKSFFSIYYLQLLMSLAMILIYLIYVLLFSPSYKIVSLVQTIYLIATVFDINWLFFGIEKFKLTVTRNSIIKILSLILIFIFVKREDDLIIYTLILSISTLVSNLFLLPFLLKEIDIIRVNTKEIFSHLKPCLVLFIPVIAISLYKIMDKIMIGSLSNISEVGYYEQAEKIIGIPLGIITALGTVMLPRISNLVSKGNDERVKDYIKKSIVFIMFLAFPIWMGLIGVSSDFVPLFLGKDFIKSGTVINYISITVVFISFANVIRTQYLIPKEKDKIYVLSVSIGAAINLFVNFLLIPKYGAVGASIGTIMAELFVAVYQTIAVRNELPINDYLKSIFPFFIKSLLMFIVVYSFKYISISSIMRIIFQIGIGGLLYVLLNYNYLQELLDLKKIFKKIGKLIRKS